jgi:hypothetical protein
MVLLASTASGYGQFSAMAAGELALSLRIQTVRKYRQDPNYVHFRSPGWFQVGVNDGYVTLAPTGCSDVAWFPPTPFCKIGATGYVIFGDINSDGLRDDITNRYWEITGVTPAAFLEPYYPEYVYLYSAPPSKLRRPLNLFADNSASIFYNINTQDVKQYDLTNYSYYREYSARALMDAEIVPGVYDFIFPKLHHKEVPVKIPSVLQHIPEGSIRNGKIQQGVRQIKLNGSRLLWSADGYVEMDPRLVNTFQWEGNDAGEIFPTDRWYFSVLNYADYLTPTLPTDPTREELPADPFTPNLFPGFVAPGNPRVLMLTPLQKTYVMPSGIIPIGSEGVCELTLLRSLASSRISTDKSERRFQCSVRFIDTYAGWASIAFLYGTPVADRASNADPDADGYTNLEEWQNATDPQVADPHPVPTVLAFVQGNALRSSSTASTGHWETKMAKIRTAASTQSTQTTANIQSVASATTYEYEFSTDMVNWSAIQAGDPNWDVLETTDEIKVVSKAPSLTGSGFLRVKITKPQPAVLDLPPATQ